jgi:hypothetical protein
MDLIKIVEDSRTTVNKQDEVIDLTSLRILKSTSQNNSLRILDRAAENRQRRVSSHLVVLAKGATEWKLDECITIPSSISCPDILLIKVCRSQSKSF